MAKAAKKKTKAIKKSARVPAKPKAAARTAKPAKKKAAKSTRPAARQTAATKIDPLNRKQYGSVSPVLAVRDIRRAVDFYKNAFGFTVRNIMDGPQGPIHAELRLRDTTLMLSPESREQHQFSATTIGNTPATLYILVDDVDSVFARAVASGAQVSMPVTDMFWGDRCGQLTDLDGNKWMIATHKAEPTEAEMAEAMRRMSQQAPQSAVASAGGESEY
jgi:PhnB protein